ncbi:MAG: hypothetical protein ACXITV_13210 [Luteibaculaceae bacterium]
MILQDLEMYYNSHCKFKLRNGKVVFGVIFPDFNDPNLICFTSWQEHKKVMGNLHVDMAGMEPNNMIQLSKEEIISAEPLLEKEEDLLD